MMMNPMTPNPILLMNGRGGDILIELIQNQGGVRGFPKHQNPALIIALETLADDGFLESVTETPDEVTYRIIC